MCERFTKTVSCVSICEEWETKKIHSLKHISNSGRAEALRLGHRHGPFPYSCHCRIWSRVAVTHIPVLALCWDTERSEKFPTTSARLGGRLMNPPGRFLPAVPWASPGWRTLAARCSSHQGDPLPAGSSWRRAPSYRSGGLLYGPGQSCMSGSSLICLWCQSGGGGKGGVKI